MENEDSVGLGKVAATCKKNKNEDPLPFLRNSSSKFQFGSGSGTVGVQLNKQEKGQLVQWTRYFSKRSEMRLILPIFFSISTSFHSMLHGLHCLLRCVELYLIKLQPDMCLLVQRGLEPHCWLRQRRWIKS
jgi:hypothetical protein